MLQSCAIPVPPVATTCDGLRIAAADTDTAGGDDDEYDAGTVEEGEEAAVGDLDESVSFDMAALVCIRSMHCKT